MQPALDDPAADAYLARLVERARRALGSRLVGAYLINSAARGDYLPGRSDLDVALIVEASLDDRLKQRLVDDLRHRALACPAPRLELVAYRRQVVGDPGARPAFEINLNTGPAVADHVTFDAAEEPPHWFVLDLAAAAERATALVGPAPENLFVSPPRSAVLDALEASMEWHDLHDHAAPNRVLNACRAWRYAVEGRWSTKTEAVGWAIDAGAAAALVRQALAMRRGERTDPLPPDAVAALAARVRSAIRGVRASGS